MKLCSHIVASQSYSGENKQEWLSRHTLLLGGRACAKQVMDLWGDVPKFLSNPDIAPKSKEKLLLLLQMKANELLIELAVSMWM